MSTRDPARAAAAPDVVQALDPPAVRAPLRAPGDHVRDVERRVAGEELVGCGCRSALVSTSSGSSPAS